MWKILLVEDSPDVVQLVGLSLGDEFDVTAVPSLAAASAQIDPSDRGYGNHWDCVLLDVMLPDGDGFELCEQLQSSERTRDIPVVFLTAKTDPIDKVAAFSAGADDYVEKPFDRRELHARVSAKLRKLRDRSERDATVQRGDLRLNLPLQRASLMEGDAEEVLDLTPHEFRLLFQLAKDETRSLTRDELMRNVWGPVVVYERTIDSHLSNLRKKLGTRSHYIQSVRGVGYRFSSG